MYDKIIELERGLNELKKEIALDENTNIETKNELFKGAMIPLISKELDDIRHERLVKRLLILLGISLFLGFIGTFGSNIYWAKKFSEYDFISYQQDGSGYNNVNTGTQGDVNNGTKSEN